MMQESQVGFILFILSVQGFYPHVNGTWSKTPASFGLICLINTCTVTILPSRCLWWNRGLDPSGSSIIWANFLGHVAGACLAPPLPFATNLLISHVADFMPQNDMLCQFLDQISGPNFISIIYWRYFFIDVVFLMAQIQASFLSIYKLGLNFVVAYIKFRLDICPNLIKKLKIEHVSSRDWV